MDIYTISNAVVVSDYLLNVSAIASTAGYRTFVRTVMLLGLLVAFFQGISSMNYRSILGYVVSVVLIAITLVNGTTDVDIESKRDGSVATVTDVPLGIAVPASMITTLGLNLAEIFEIGFAPVSGTTFGTTGNVVTGTDDPFFHVRSVQAVGKLFSDPNNLKAIEALDPNFPLFTNMSLYVSRCLHPKAVKTDPPLRRNQLYTDDLFTILAPGPLAGPLLVPVIDFSSSATSQSCNELWNEINRRLPARPGSTTGAIPHTAAQWQAAIQSDAQFFTGCLSEDTSITLGGVDAPTSCYGSIVDNVSIGGVTGLEYVTAAMWRLAVERGLRSAAMEMGEDAHAAALDSAIRQRQAQWQGESGIFVRSISIFAGFIEAFSIAIAPIMLLVLVFGPAGVRLAMRYMWLLVWLQLWFPLMSVVNFMLYSLVAYGNPDVGGTLTLSLNTIELYERHIIEVAGIADYSLTMVTALSTMLVYGASAIVSNTVSQRMSGQDHFDERVPERSAIGSAPMRQWQPEATIDSYGLGRSATVGNAFSSFMAGVQSGATTTIGSTDSLTSNAAVTGSVGTTATSGNVGQTGRVSSFGTVAATTNSSGVNVQSQIGEGSSVGTRAEVGNGLRISEGSQGQYGVGGNLGIGGNLALGGNSSTPGAAATAPGAAPAAGAPAAGGNRVGLRVGAEAGLDGSMRFTNGRERAETTGSSAGTAEEARVGRTATGSRGFEQRQGTQAQGGTQSSNMSSFGVQENAGTTASSTAGRGIQMEERDSVHGSMSNQQSIDPQIAAQRFAQLPQHVRDGWYQAAAQAGMWGQVNRIMAQHGNMLTSHLGSAEAALGMAMMVVMGGGNGTLHSDPNVRAERAVMGRQLMNEAMGYESNGPGYGSLPEEAFRNRDAGAGAHNPRENLNEQIAAQFDRVNRGRQGIQPGGPSIDGPLPNDEEMLAAGAGVVAGGALGAVNENRAAIMEQVEQFNGRLAGSTSLRESLANGGTGLLENLVPAPIGTALNNVTGGGLTAASNGLDSLLQSGNDTLRWIGNALGGAASGQTQEERIAAFQERMVGEGMSQGGSQAAALFAAGVVMSNLGEAAGRISSGEGEAWREAGAAAMAQAVAMSPGIGELSGQFEQAVENTPTLFGDSGRSDVLTAFSSWATAVEQNNAVAREIEGSTVLGEVRNELGLHPQGFPSANTIPDPNVPPLDLTITPANGRD